MERVAKGSGESLLLAKWSKEGEGRPGPGCPGQKDTGGRSHWRGDHSSQLWWDPVRQTHDCCQRSGKMQQQERLL